MNKKLYVGNLLYEVTGEELRELFSQAGEVVMADIVSFRDTGRSKGFGFVEMATEEEAQKAIEMFSEYDYRGRKLLVSVARPPQPRDDRGGGGGFRPRGGSGGGYGGGGSRGGYGRDSRSRDYNN